MFGHCFMISFFVTFLVVQSSCIEERAGCFTFCSCCCMGALVLSILSRARGMLVQGFRFFFSRLLAKVTHGEKNGESLGPNRSN